MALAVAAAMVFTAAPVTALGITGPHVTEFFASPDYINVGMRTDVTLTIGSSAGSNMDNYHVSVWSPSGVEVGGAWYNFTAPGTMSMVLGNASAGLMAAVTEPGFYELRAEWWNDTSLAFEPVAEAAVRVTDVLLVQTEFAAGSDPYQDLHNCQISEEIQRGDGIIARGYVRYASNNEILNATKVPTAIGNVTGTLFQTSRDAVTKTLNYNAGNFFWRTGWQLDWNQAVGVFQFTVNAADGLGNSGMGVSPVAGVYGALKVIPAVLPTDVWIEDGMGHESRAFYPGATVTIVAFPYYDQHFNHNYPYTNTDAANKNESYRLGPDRGGVVTAVLGYGTFDEVQRTFATQLATPSMTFDSATQTWRGTWTVPATGALATNISVRVFAHDGAATPNEGKAVAAFSTLAEPEPVVEYHNQTVYQNNTVEVQKEGTMDAMLGYGLAGVGIVIGAVVGMMLARGRKGGGSAMQAPAPASKPEKAEGEKKKKDDEGWD